MKPDAGGWRKRSLIHGQRQQLLVQTGSEFGGFHFNSLFSIVFDSWLQRDIFILLSRCGFMIGKDGGQIK